ncbi:2-polyprenyl-6-methoxyphenol hydroxylase [Psychrobacillus psychrotolerans]|uniref:2-polyprenyl-6-methoxyphenol hydroxylase n=1 Tax=Psychrobacillus psychrotolerans TaxID=126156 RepID=A0A1I6ASW1_9BACI|nr:FAD-dependent monooxygenase [Psychrobacillus psychrotolerans]SFQ71719.1 2-polyprenyl-6-methoxyphenol hydroxylase [Psychrobacillus psychrotolerans]
MKIAIIGGGIGGLCAAVTLQKQGFSVQVYEASPTFQPVGAGIGIGSNALQALMEIGVGEEIFANGHALHQQVFLDTYGNTLNTIDLTVLKELYGQENITIHRADLHNIFLKALKPDTLHFNKKYISVEQNDNQVTVYFEDGTTVTANLLIAADGIHSSIRQQLLPGSVTRYAGYTCWRGITENNGRVDEYTSSEYWATQGRFGMAPMKNGLIYWFACINTTARNPQFQKLTAPEIGDIFDHLPKVVHNIITTTSLERILHHDLSDIKPLRQFVFGRVALLGDAAHATTPNMGQGAGQAIEDAIVLGNGFKQFEHVDKVLAFYEEKRVARTAKVIRLSRQIGEIAQIQSRLIASVRDFLFPFIPSKLLMRQLKFLFDVKLK